MVLTLNGIKVVLLVRILLLLNKLLVVLSIYIILLHLRENVASVLKVYFYPVIKCIVVPQERLGMAHYVLLQH